MGWVVVYEGERLQGFDQDRSRFVPKANENVNL
jgi:hypothetical protein